MGILYILYDLRQVYHCNWVMNDDSSTFRMLLPSRRPPCPHAHSATPIKAVYKCQDHRMFRSAVDGFFLPTPVAVVVVNFTQNVLNRSWYYPFVFASPGVYCCAVESLQCLIYDALSCHCFTYREITPHVMIATCKIASILRQSHQYSAPTVWLVWSTLFRWYNRFSSKCIGYSQPESLLGSPLIP